METLITIGVIIYIIFSIRKALSFGKKPGEKPAPGGWQEKLQDMARQIKEEMEKANQQSSGNIPVPPPLPRAPSPSGWADMEETPEPLVFEESVDEEARDYETNVIPEAPAKESEVQSWLMKKEGMVKPAPEMAQKKPGVVRSRNNDLKRAIIWSEILAKPLSLRD